MMRAAVFRRVGEPLTIERLPDPEPGVGQVVIAVRRCGVCSSDLHLTEQHGMTASAGTVLGHEYCGEVVAVGPGVNGLRSGDLIVAMPTTGCGACDTCRRGRPQFCASFEMLMGGYAEYALAGAAGALKLPAGLSAADGALVEPLAVALHGVRLARHLRDVPVLVLGAGPIGLATTYWARRLGAGPITVLATSRRREALARLMGAAQFLVAAELDANPAALEPAPLVFDCVGAVGTLGRCFELAAAGGEVVVTGFCMVADSVFLPSAIIKELHVQFSLTYALTDFHRAVDALDAGHVEPRSMISRTVTLDELPAAFEALRAGSPHTKIQLDPWSAH
jgi:2-desacetyl-2-hydroxyethyl bacteriochlorophyllide A dehydrogenase